MRMFCSQYRVELPIYGGLVVNFGIDFWNMDFGIGLAKADMLHHRQDGSIDTSWWYTKDTKDLPKAVRDDLAVVLRVFHTTRKMPEDLVQFKTDSRGNIATVSLNYAWTEACHTTAWWRHAGQKLG